MNFDDNSFNCSYATYNLIGSIKIIERQKLINEMKRVTIIGGKVINITWKQDQITTQFLKEYYPSMGIKIHEIDDNKTITDKGTFERISIEELRKYYDCSKFSKIVIEEVGPLWIAMIGVKI